MKNIYYMGIRTDYIKSLKKKQRNMEKIILNIYIIYDPPSFHS